MKLLIRLLLSALFVGAGVSHLQRPEMWERIVPPPLPAYTCVIVSGLAEICLGLAYLFAPSRAAWGLVALLIAIFPANIYMAVAGVKFGDFPSQPWMAWARLPVQFVLIALVLWARR